MKIRLSGPSRLALGAALTSVLCTPGLAAAQSAGAPEIEEVIVTGSLIAGTPEDAALPVDVITGQDLAKRGSPTILELIKTLPSVGPVLGDSNQFNSNAAGRPGGGTINLRGLGANRTLVLLNGRRLADGVTDTNFLPMAAIGRVEILKDGAAATYGSDAIGGVVNFITRKNLEGFEAAADYRYVSGSDGDYTASLNWGRGFDAGDLFVSLGYQHRSELRTIDRDWAVTDYLRNPAHWSALGNPGAINPRNGTTSLQGNLRDGGCQNLGGFAGYSGAQPACYFTYIPYDNLIEDEDRFQLYAEANVDLSETTRLHVEANYAVTSMPNLRFSPSYPPLTGPTGPGAVYTVPRSNPGFLTALQQAGAAPATIAAADNIALSLWRPLAAGGNPAEGGLGGVGDRKYDLLRISADLKGKFENGWGWDVAATYTRDTVHSRNNDILITRLQAALNGLGGPNCQGSTPGANGCQYFNPFSHAIAANPALGLINPGYVAGAANSPELAGWLFAPLITENEQTTFVADLVVDGGAGLQLPGGEAVWALGGQYRSVVFDGGPANALFDQEITPCPTPGDTTCAFRTGPYIYLGQGRRARLDSSVWAVFGELNLPVTDDLNVQLALRHEDYGGATGATTNPQLRVKWQVLPALALRGSVGTTFRGPTAANRSASGTTGTVGITAAGNNFKAVDTFGNPDVGPEKALTYNLGAILDMGRARAIVDYWSYDLEDQITSAPANIIATAVGGVGNGSQAVNCAHPLRNLITFNNGDTCIQGVTLGADITRVRSQVVNGPRIKTSGIDASLDADLPAFGGDLGLGASISYVLQYKQDEFRYGGALVSRGYDAAGYTNYDRLPGTVPKWRANAYAQFGRGDHNLRTDVTYVDSVVDNRAPISVFDGARNLVPITFGQKVDAFISVDLTYRWTLPDDLTLTASVLNAFDRDPSRARLELSYDPFLGNPYGRTFKLGVRKTF